ncbi:GNAT family N-acetyltransferase [Actinoplanes sp. NPDC051494]|uniref:GNAT family N-acetyltransferase n=1 Tax=Actinoplanes sp. NPDC051494 TaxID=3363907 RepID=UPI00379D3865
MLVRRGGVGDVAAHAELRGVGPDEFAAYAAWVAAHVDTHLPFVAEVDGSVVGVAWLHVAERVPGSRSMERRYGDVQAVMVREEHRGQGVGSALMVALLEAARGLGLLHVTVHSGRRAVDFYLRNGFDHHRRLLLWEQGGTSMDHSAG